MSDLPAPTAHRLRRPSWRDSRLLVGVLLVLASTAIGAFVLSRADDRVPMYAARSGLVPGQPLTEDDVVRVAVQLGDSTTDYVSAGPGLPKDHVVLREVRAGELVPTTAVGSRAQAESQPVTLRVDATSAQTLRVGSVVDVYVNRPAAGAKAGIGSMTFAGPELALERVVVARLSDDDAVLGSSRETQPVQVMVPRQEVKAIIGDVDLGAKITLVAVPGAVAQKAP